MDPTHAALAVCVMGLAAGVKSTFGFGDALVAMPLLAMFLGVHTATPLVALVGAAVSAWVGWTDRASIDWASARRLLIGGLLGVPFGVVALTRLPELWLYRGLGGLLVLVALGKVLPFSAPEAARSVRTAWPLGMLSGALGAAINTSGPPIVVYATLQQWGPQKARASFQGFFLPLAVVVLGGHAVAGLWTREVLWLTALCVPAVAGGVWVGARLNKAIPAERFTGALYVTLAVLGLMLILRQP